MTVIGFDPEISVRCDSRKFKVYNRSGKLLHKWNVTELLSQLKKIVPHVEDDRFRFVGGAVGYISYDAIRFWERLPVRHNKKKQTEFPLLEFGIYSDGILYDHIKKQVYYFYTGKKSRLTLIQKIAQTHTHAKNPTTFFYSPPKTNTSE